MTCINCSTESDGKFCPVCSQRMTVKRITFKEGFLDFWGRIYGFDAQFPRTLRDLTLRPGIAAKKFIEGNRALYYGPIGYYFLMITVMFLVASILRIDFSEVMLARSRDLAEAPKSGTGPAEAQRLLVAAVVENYKIFVFTMVIFMTVSLRIFFRKSGYNLLEHSVMVFFVLGHMYWLSIVDLVILKSTGLRASFVFNFIIMVLYFGFAASQIYSYQSKTKAFVKGVVAYLAALLVFIIVLTTVSLIVFMNDPEMRELMKNKDG